MKKYTLTILILFTAFFAVNAQNKNVDSSQTEEHSYDADTLHDDEHDHLLDTAKVATPSIYVWKITPRLGEWIFVPRDTVVLNFHQSMLVDGQSVAMGYLGNIGSPAQSKIFFDRPEPSRFVFQDALYLWRKGPEDHYFVNTKIPYSNVKYQSGGGGENAENRFQGELSMNPNKKLNFGFDFDYIYSRGFYYNQSNKQISYDFYASYIGDKYKMHAYARNSNRTILENGGITDFLYITNPGSDALAGYSGNTKDIPTQMKGINNRLRGRHFYVTNRYDLGNDQEQYAVNDSTMAWRKKDNYVPLASAIFTTNYSDQRRVVRSSYNDLDSLYFPYYKVVDGQNTVELDSEVGSKYFGALDDYMSYYSFKNTLALAMNEGFRSWTKFGLTAFIEYDMRRYSIPGELPGLHERKSDDALFIGGVLSKEKGKYLKYRASAQKDLLNEDYRLEGEITTMINLFGKSVSAKANAYIKNISPSFFENNFSSKYWNWQYDLKATRRWYIGGEISFPELSFSQTKISGGVENIDNYTYYFYDRNEDVTSPDYIGKRPRQGSAKVMALRLDQKLRAGILNWDNQIVYQYTDNEKVLPLPQLSVYTNLYLTTKISKVLTIQLGADAHYHSSYYMQGYDPLTMQFYNQNDRKLGDFPVTTAYLNLHLKYTRFYVMMYNITNEMFNGESFSLYRYPVNPRILKLGISWQFNN
ncbi:MAG: putative porin [Dysgonomonas sp.]|nr:putative porin [Dysgonomonas sp.]